MPPERADSNDIVVRLTHDTCGSTKLLEQPQSSLYPFMRAAEGLLAEIFFGPITQIHFRGPRCILLPNPADFKHACFNRPCVCVRANLSVFSIQLKDIKIFHICVKAFSY